MIIAATETESRLGYLVNMQTFVNLFAMTCRFRHLDFDNVWRRVCASKATLDVTKDDILAVAQVMGQQSVPRL